MTPEERTAYIEDFALHFEQSGLPRIAGRILGLLMICDPPHRSATELAEELQASKGSVSTMTRFLVSAGLLERASIPGARANYFQFALDGFEHLFAQKMQQLVSFTPLSKRGLALLAGKPPQQRARLLEMAALYTFYEREMPLLLDKWHQERESILQELTQEGESHD